MIEIDFVGRFLFFVFCFLFFVFCFLFFVFCFLAFGFGFGFGFAFWLLALFGVLTMNNLLNKEEIVIPLRYVKEGMVVSDYINKINEKGQTITVVGPNTRLSKRIISRLFLHGIKDILIFRDQEAISILQIAEPLAEKNRTVERASKLEGDLESKRALDTEKTFNIEKTLNTDKTLNTEKKPLMQISAPPIKPLLDKKLKEEAVKGIRAFFALAGLKTSKLTTAYQMVKELDTVVDRLVDTISADGGAVVHVNDIKSYDEYTYHHSLSVAVLSLAIGQGLGLNRAQMKKLGMCAILHDIGKIEIPINYINKPGKLTEKEYAVAKEHARSGGAILQKNNIGDQELWSSVIHHHERIDGTGYPDGLKGDEIPLNSQIVSVADVYDAVTSYRSYRRPMSPANALDLVMSEAGRSFSFEIVRVFISKLKLYPVNSVVQLSDNRLALVIDNTNSTRPIVRVLGESISIDLVEVDNQHLVITGIVESQIKHR